MIHTPMEYFLYLVVIPAAIIGFQLCGFVNWLKRRLFYLKYTKRVKFKTFPLKPVDCAGCLTFWSVLFTSTNPVTAFAAFALCYVYERLVDRV